MPSCRQPCIRAAGHDVGVHMGRKGHYSLHCMSALFTLRVRYSFCEGDWRENPMRRPECRSPEGGHASEKPDIGTVLDIRIESAGHPDRRRRGQGGESHGRRKSLSESRRPPVLCMVIVRPLDGDTKELELSLSAAWHFMRGRDSEACVRGAKRRWIGRDSKLNIMAVGRKRQGHAAGFSEDVRHKSAPSAHLSLCCLHRPSTHRGPRPDSLFTLATA